jgi:hypothetical protein
MIEAGMIKNIPANKLEMLYKARLSDEMILELDQAIGQQKLARVLWDDYMKNLTEKNSKDAQKKIFFPW